MKDLDSMKALMTFMDKNGMNRNDKPQYTRTVGFTNILTGRSGDLECTFNSGQHSSFGPYLEVDDTIRSFKIQYTAFKTQYQKFIYEEEDNTLKVTGDGYSFSITL